MALQIEWKRGDTLPLTFLAKDLEGGVGDIFDGVTYRLQVRDSAKKVVVELSSEVEGDFVVDAAAGTITAIIHTDTFTAQKHYTDLEATYPSGYVVSSKTIVLKIEEDITV